jgi:hypothetical protein
MICPSIQTIVIAPRMFSNELHELDTILGKLDCLNTQAVTV